MPATSKKDPKTGHKIRQKTDKKSSKKDRKILVLLDSHAIIHRAYHALPDFASSKGLPTGALYGLSTMLMGIIEKFKPSYVVACYDLPQPTYRHEAYKEYKAGRKKTDDNLVEQLKSSRTIFEAFNIPMYDKVGFEADDMLGTIVERVISGKVSGTSKEDLSNMDIMIASGDMDTLQLIVGKRVRVFTLKKGIKDTVVYDENAVKERFGFAPKFLPDYKGLRGDPSDNIIGISGIGEKTATTLIGHFHTIEDMYKAIEKTPDQVKKLGGISERIFELLKNGKEEAMFSKMLATIRRDAPIDFKIPEKEWGEHFSPEKVEVLFREYEFRSLIARVKQLATGKINGETKNDLINRGRVSDEGFSEGSKDGAVGKGDKNGDDADPSSKNKKETFQYQPLFAAIDPFVAKRLEVAISVLDSTLSKPNIEDVFAYAGTSNPEDAEKKIISDIESRGLGRVLRDIEWPLIPILEQMEKDGVKIDVVLLKDLSREYHKKLSFLERTIWSESGSEFNINSPKQLSDILFNKLSLGGKTTKKTASGVRSTKESELEKMKGTHPVIDKVLEYRELAKLLSTYIDVLPGLADERQRIHPHFLQMGAATGRMASQNPGVQNIPIKTEQGRAIRRAFICEDGWTLLSLDYSQIELRIAAILSEDEKLLEIFKNGTDIHSGVAAQVFKVPENEVTKDMRRQAKVINFGVMYGMGVNSLRSNLGSTREEAQIFYNEYFKTFKGLAAYLENTKKEAAKKGYTETLFGRRRYFEGIHSKLPFIRASAERMAINAPIQGTEADIIKISMIKIQKRLDEEGLLKNARLLLQVHDELVYEVRTPDLKKVAKIAKQEMEKVLSLDETKGVPITTSAEVGKNWDEMEELIF